jgi:hypothetical protein
MSKPMTVYDALMRDGAAKRTASVDSLPTMSEMWMLLRKAYGARLVGATLVAVIDNDGYMTVQTLTFPPEGEK